MEAVNSRSSVNSKSFEPQSTAASVAPSSHANDDLDKYLISEMLDTALIHENKNEYDIVVKLYFSLAGKGIGSALRRLYLMILGQRGIQQLLDYCKNDSQQGCRVALWALGTLHLYGFGVEKNPVTARQYWKISAQKGFVPALFNIGMLYYNGEGVDKNYGAARKCWEKLPKGMRDAQFNLGLIYEFGMDVGVDNLKALECYKLAPNQKILPASARILAMCLDGRASMVDPVFARNFLEEAAQKGNREAQSILLQIRQRIPPLQVQRLPQYGQIAQQSQQHLEQPPLQQQQVQQQQVQQEEQDERPLKKMRT